jgi:hypothetical protein
VGDEGVAAVSEVRAYGLPDAPLLGPKYFMAEAYGEGRAEPLYIVSASTKRRALLHAIEDAPQRELAVHIDVSCGGEPVAVAWRDARTRQWRTK